MLQRAFARIIQTEREEKSVIASSMQRAHDEIKLPPVDMPLIVCKKASRASERALQCDTRRLSVARLLCSPAERRDQGVCDNNYYYDVQEHVYGIIITFMYMYGKVAAGRSHTHSRFSLCEW